MRASRGFGFFGLLIVGWLAAFAPGAEAQTLGTPPGPAPVVYVSDFELDTAEVTQDTNPVDQARRFAGGILPGGGLLHRRDPQMSAPEIVATMSDKVVDDLRKKGIDARRLPAGSAAPAQGWLVRGVFLSVDEGNRVRRAMVGFNSGKSQFEVAFAADDLAVQATPTPLYQEVEGQSGQHLPGAAVALNPYVAIAKFVLSRGDERKALTSAAQQVADGVALKVRPPQ
ncbi:DUF4410 domain-containing protein [Paraburkholderia ferrariae]|uniref:DUF4410 domain-containing protein n=1 Tax=Paraburkholderia ferrariae TaxID=386056 RepID=UPI00069349B6|nr:DUF4410 domain-containing protein [Paraburkholderia ferrariae]